MTTERFELPIRIVVEDPVPGLAMVLQRGHGERIEGVPPASRSAEAVTFDLEVTVEGRLKDGRPRLLGAVVQGPPDARFVYLIVGRYAGQCVGNGLEALRAPVLTHPASAGGCAAAEWCVCSW